MSARTIIRESKFRDALNAVKRGEDDSRKKLAQMVFSGSAVTLEEIKRLENQVEKGDTEAMWKLGLCKEHGIGTRQSMKEAALLYEQSNASGDPVGIILSIPISHVQVGKEEEGNKHDEDEEEEDECYEDYDDEDYDDSFDDYADDILDRIEFTNTSKVSWSHPMKGVNVQKVKTYY